MAVFALGCAISGVVRRIGGFPAGFGGAHKGPWRPFQAVGDSVPSPILVVLVWRRLVGLGGGGGGRSRASSQECANVATRLFINRGIASSPRFGEAAAAELVSVGHDLPGGVRNCAGESCVGGDSPASIQNHALHNIPPPAILGCDCDSPRPRQRASSGGAAMAAPLHAGVLLGCAVLRRDSREGKIGRQASRVASQ